MPARPELIRPDDAAIAAAMSRTLTALAALVQALGDGEHTINLVVDRTDDRFVRSQADLSVGTAPLRLAVLDEDDFDALRTLLVFALEGSTTQGRPGRHHRRRAQPVRAAGPYGTGGCTPWTRPNSSRPSSRAPTSPPYCARST
ncbi:hypothetical protein, partial [Streptomyces sp. KR55]|uniref:hypothetical protein n=1 Tax=Streptomyces sp. KR55 TaxID=3457425 RepID=UPI003FD3B22B